MDNSCQDFVRKFVDECAKQEKSIAIPRGSIRQFTQHVGTLIDGVIGYVGGDVVALNEAIELITCK